MSFSTARIKEAMKFLPCWYRVSMNMTWKFYFGQSILDNKFNLEAIFVTLEETQLYLTKLNYETKHWLDWSTDQIPDCIVRPIIERLVW